MGSTVPSFSDDPYSDEHLTDPYPLFDRLRSAGPVVWLEKYQVHAVTRFAECREILDDHRTFISGAGVGPKNLHRESSWRPPGILETDPPVHTAMRTALGGVISPRGVRSLRAGFEPFADELLDRLRSTGEFDGVTDLAEVFPLRVFGDAVGIPRPGRAENLLAHGAMNFSQFGPEGARNDEYLRRGEGTHAWVMSMTARENLAPGGLGEQVWGYVDRGEISAEQAPLLVRAMLSAGLDTTVIAIGNTLVALLNHPEEWEKIRQDPRLVKFAIDEALRFESPFQSFFRTTSVDTVFHGVDLPVGTKVLLFPGAANRDPDRFGPDAHLFRIDRSAAGHLAFGMGIHQCVGQPITRLEMDVLFTGLAGRASTLEPTGPRIPYLHNTLRGWSSIPMRIT
ncbi:cytochrome P450 [Nakamurella silvestris]|nr:cytochrome P450 [Nakamurella silvestris]